MKQPLPGWSADVTDRLMTFQCLLRHWNPRINLVAPADLGNLWERHILDSAQLSPLLPQGCTRFIDLGSGGGFPGLVLAMVTGCRVDLIEADQRKAAFLREAARVTRTEAAVHAIRVQSARLAPASAITARALAPLSVLLDLAEPLLARDGCCLFPKGATAEDELTSAANQWHMQVERFASQTRPGATIFRLSEIRRAGHTS